jgi:ferric-dicitrate binding protein FerR (iron transport regulator)
MHLNTFIQDLIDNPSFRKWVLSDFEVDDDIWSAYIDEHEHNESDINDAIRLVREIHNSQFEVPPFASEKAWNKIQKSTSISVENPNQSGGVLFSLVFRRIGIAAALIGIVSFIWLLNTSSNTEVFSGDREIIAHRLPDGSLVTLNRKSAISYDQESWSLNREIHLEGEAFFEVKKGSKFRVSTQQGEVMVLGTSFNVHNRDKSFTVTCYTGKVAVKNTSNQVILLPGQEVSQDNVGSLDMITAKVTESKSPWINNLIRFHKASLEKVVQELHVYYGEIYTFAPDLASMEFTGILPADNNIKALENLTWALGLKYKISKEGQYHIYR